MKQQDISNRSKHSATRRRFLKYAGVIALTATTATAGPGSVISKHVELLAEGVINMNFVIPPPGVVIPPGIEARVRMTFPAAGTKDVLAVQIFAIPSGLPVPLPEAPPLVPALPTDPVTISYFEVRVSDIVVGTSPVFGTGERLESIQIAGMTISNGVLSPFGNLTGAPSVMWSSFLITDPTTGAADFHFLGGATAGSHATVAPVGKGFVRIGK